VNAGADKGGPTLRQTSSARAETSFWTRGISGDLRGRTWRGVSQQRERDARSLARPV